MKILTPKEVLMSQKENRERKDALDNAAAQLCDQLVNHWNAAELSLDVEIKIYEKYEEELFKLAAQSGWRMGNSDKQGKYVISQIPEAHNHA